MEITHRSSWNWSKKCSFRFVKEKAQVLRLQRVRGDGIMDIISKIKKGHPVVIYESIYHLNRKAGVDKCKKYLLSICVQYGH
ncbi:hypothetical protein T08_505 [Trichinella sp. T8]|nr:hypothetical protein T08_505 [Trichinella sp. T8]